MKGGGGPGAASRPGISPVASSVPDSVPREHRRFYQLARIAFLVALAAHAAFLGLFLLMGELELALFNVVSVAVWGSCLLLHARGRYRRLGGPAFAEIFAHATLCVLILGTGSGFHLYLLTGIALPFLIPFYGTVLRWSLAGIAALAFAALLVYGETVPPASEHPDVLLAALLAGNAVGTGIVIAAIIATYERVVIRAEEALEEAYRRTEELLHAVLPSSIVERLKRNPGGVAERHDEVSILFADLVGFTALAGRMTPEDVVELLNRIFSEFDALLEGRPVEKIKTIGDAYMAVSGAPNAHERHAEALAELALEMRERTRAIAREAGRRLELRIGLHSGPAVAGVIGTRRLAYDLWGDAVNTASRMEALGLPGEIQVTEATMRRLSERYRLEPRGTVEVPGKGPMATWLLQGPKR